MTRIIKANEVNVTAIFKWHSRIRQLKSAATITVLKLILFMGSEVLMIINMQSKNQRVHVSQFRPCMEC